MEKSLYSKKFLIYSAIIFILGLIATKVFDVVYEAIFPPGPQQMKISKNDTLVTYQTNAQKTVVIDKSYDSATVRQKENEIDYWKQKSINALNSNTIRKDIHDLKNQIKRNKQNSIRKPDNTGANIAKRHFDDNTRFSNEHIPDNKLKKTIPDRKVRELIPNHKPREPIPDLGYNAILSNQNKNILPNMKGHLESPHKSFFITSRPNFESKSRSINVDFVIDNRPNFNSLGVVMVELIKVTAGNIHTQVYQEFFLPQYGHNHLIVNNAKKRGNYILHYGVIRESDLNEEFPTFFQAEFRFNK